MFKHLDDLLIFSLNEEQHFQDFDFVFQKLQEHGHKISLEKSVFSQASLQSLEHLITQEGLRLPEEKIAEIADIPQPKDSATLGYFLAIVGFYRRMTPNCLSS